MSIRGLLMTLIVQQSPVLLQCRPSPVLHCMPRAILGILHESAMLMVYEKKHIKCTCNCTEL